MAPPLVISPKPARLRLNAAAMGALLILSIAIMFSLELVMYPALRVTVMVVAFLGCTMAGYGLIYFTLRALQCPPLLRAEADGLYFDVSLLNQGRVDWSNIKGYALVKHAGRKLALVYLESPYALIDQQKGLRKRALRANLSRYRTPVAIPAGLIDGDPVQVLTDLGNWKP